MSLFKSQKRWGNFSNNCQRKPRQSWQDGDAVKEVQLEQAQEQWRWPPFILKGISDSSTSPGSSKAEAAIRLLSVRHVDLCRNWGVVIKTSELLSLQAPTTTSLQRVLQQRAIHPFSSQKLVTKATCTHFNEFFFFPPFYQGRFQHVWPFQPSSLGACAKDTEMGKKYKYKRPLKKKKTSSELAPLAQPCHPLSCPSPPHELSPRPPRESFRGPRSLIRDVLKLAFGRNRAGGSQNANERPLVFGEAAESTGKNNFLHVEAEKPKRLSVSTARWH